MQIFDIADCPACKHTRATMLGKALPDPGDPMLCTNCGSVLRYVDDDTTEVETDPTLVNDERHQQLGELFIEIGLSMYEQDSIPEMYQGLRPAARRLAET